MSKAEKITQNLNLASFSRLLKISFRNIFRNKRRTILTLFILILGGTGLILLGGFFNSLNFRLMGAMIYGDLGHLQVGAPGYYTYGATAPLDFLIDDYREIKKIIDSDPRVWMSAPQLTFEGMISNGETDLPVLAVGGEPDSDLQIMNVESRETGEKAVALLEGKPLSDEDPYGILVGVELKNALGLEVGDQVSFITTKKAGSIDGADFYVRGVMGIALKNLGGRIIKMPLQTAQKILDLPNQVQKIVVLLALNDHGKELMVKEELGSIFQDRGRNLEIVSWHEMAGVFFQTKQFLDQIYLVVQIIISFIFILSIANTINMALLERVREYGTMLAIGNNRGTVLYSIILEACILGILGSLLAVGFGIFIAKIVSTIGIWMPPPPVINGGPKGILVMIKLYPSLVLETFFICFISTVVSSLYPGYKITRLPIVESLGYV